MLEVDISKQDFLVATLGNYNLARVAWEGMDDPTPATRKNLDRQLTHLAKAIRSRLGEGATSWDATDTSTPTHIYAN